MSARAIRLVAWICAIAILTTTSGVRMAVAQQGSEFLPGEWAGEMRFRFGTQDAGSAVVYIGSGRIELTGQGDLSEPTTVEGDLSFSVEVRGLTNLAATGRLYEGNWRVGGEGSEAVASGDVTARGVDAAKIDNAGGAVEVPIEFVTEGTGALTVEAASCASVSGTFTTDLIRPPGGAAGVGFTAPFMAFPIGSGLSQEELEEMMESLRVGYWDIYDSIQSGKLSWEGDTSGELAGYVRFLLEWVEDMNQIIADAGLCGPATGRYEHGVAQWRLASLMAELLDLVSQNGEFFTAQEMLDFFRLGAALGVFTLQYDGIPRILEQYQVAIGDHLDAALRADQADTVSAIHNAACMWGWIDLKERSRT